jgi:phosphoglycolate phosphatase-like HAD superfamily hydrolase
MRCTECILDEQPNCYHEVTRGQRTIAIDFDGTLCDMNNVPAGKKMGPPMAGAVEGVNRLIELGYKPTVYTVRATSVAAAKAVAQWLAYFKFPVMDVTNNKPNCDLYLDDKAVRFTSWEQVRRDIR